MTTSLPVRALLGGAVVLSFVAGCGSSPFGAAAGSPEPTSYAPWQVVSDQPAGRTATTAAYVSVAPGSPLIVTGPLGGSAAKRPATNVVASVPLGGGQASSAVLPSSVVGVVRPPGRPTRVISLVVTSSSGGRGLNVSELSPTSLRPMKPKRLTVGSPSIDAVGFAQNARGDGVLAWSESRVGTGNDPIEKDVSRIRVVTGRWGAFGAPTTLHEVRGVGAGYGSVSVAINASGKALVGSDVGGFAGVTAWIGSVSTGRFDSPITARHSGLIGPLRVAMTDRGRSVLAWRNSNGDAMEPHGPIVVSGTSIAPGARRAAPIQQIDRGPEWYPSASGFDLIAAPGGEVTLAFSAFRDDPGAGDLREAAFATTTDASGRFGQPQELAHAGSIGGLAVRADGTAIVTLASAAASDFSPAALQARVRPAGATEFGPVEPVANVPQSTGTQPVTSQPVYLFSAPVPDAPIPAFDPSTGRPVIAFTTAAHGSERGRLIVIARDRP